VQASTGPIQFTILSMEGVRILRRDHLPGASNPDEVVGAPTHCPACRSQKLTTASKVVNAETYWRCEACGEVWNVARQRAGARYAAYRPFGR
jgi:hypothetical protein